MAYHVDIAIFTDDTEDVETPTDLSWSLTQSAGETPDEIVVLAGLEFGWSAPAEGLWPVQPNPMACSLAINVPDFSDISVLDGDTLSVEVKADTDGDIIARFYGNVTDWKASNRDGRPGVTLSLVAVDPMAGLNELFGIPFPEGSFPDFHEENIVSVLWGAFGGADDVSDLWTSPARFVWPDSFAMGDPVNALTVVRGLLLQAVNVTSQSRMIVSPNIGASGAVHSDPSSGRSFTLDTISSDPEVSSGVDPGDDPPPPFEPPANAVRRDAITWTSATGQNPGLIVAAGYGGDAANRVLAPVAGSTNRAIATVPVTCNDEPEAQDTADFYAAVAFDQWQIDGVTIEVTRKDVTVPADLFPNWKAAEGAIERAACYSRHILISGIDPTRTPDGTGVIAGHLVGATCRIANGALALDLAIRRPISTAPDDHSFALGGYALAPLGELAVT